MRIGFIPLLPTLRRIFRHHLKTTEVVALKIIELCEVREILGKDAKRFMV